MIMWYDKLALIGLIVGFFGLMAFVVGFGFMLSANRQARAEFRTSIQEVHDALRR